LDTILQTYKNLTKHTIKIKKKKKIITMIEVTVTFGNFNSNCN